MRLVWLPITAVALTALAATPLAAQRWGYPGGYPYGWDRGPDRFPTPDRSRDGKVEVTRFVAEGPAAQALGHGPIAIAKADDALVDERERATYEAAVIDRLAGAGYDTQVKAGDGGQTVELHIRHAEIAPPEAPHRPVSGEMSVGVSSHGGSYESMAIGIDLRKPAKALLSTRLEARILDKASGAVLWEGRADISTRDGDARWSDQAIAAKLAEALFAGFPGKNGETIAAR
ncbi:MAG: hypothetical protein ACXWJC_02800 [Croceibacterium sp.]